MGKDAADHLERADGVRLDPVVETPRFSFDHLLGEDYNVIVDLSCVGDHDHRKVPT
jgi:hypothetical protein